jgi:hypothetical protein
MSKLVLRGHSINTVPSCLSLLACAKPQYTDPSTNMYFQRLRLDYSAIHVGPANMETVMEGAIDKVNPLQMHTFCLFDFRVCSMSCFGPVQHLLRSYFRIRNAAAAHVNSLLQHCSSVCTYVSKFLFIDNLQITTCVQLCYALTVGGCVQHDMDAVI